MRIAVFSDIHGNPYACRTVLDGIAADGEFDHVVAAGDFCYAGSNPAACIDMLQDAGVMAVYGNTDEFIFAPSESPPDDNHSKLWEQIKVSAKWASERIGAQRSAWLAGLPLSLKFSPNENPADELLVVHANPKNVYSMISPSEAEQIRMNGELNQADSDPELLTLLEGVQSKVIVFGHVHYTSIRELNGYKLVNVSPCNLPTFDGDWRARYTIFEWEGDEWQITRRYLEYDHNQERDAMLAGGFPDKDWVAKLFNKINEKS